MFELNNMYALTVISVLVFLVVQAKGVSVEGFEHRSANLLRRLYDRQSSNVRRDLAASTCMCYYDRGWKPPITRVKIEHARDKCPCGCVYTLSGYENSCCLTCLASTDSKTKQSCFPSDSRVTIYNGKGVPGAYLLNQNGKEIEMKHLRAGHRVLTVQNGRRVFSEVKTFLKRQSNKNATYVTMTTEQGNQVTMSGNHLLFVSTSNMSAEMKTRPAISVKTGEYIFSTKSCPRGLCPERVVQLSLSVKQGLYVPVTDAGTLVVDGVLASCYSFTLHHLEHIFTAPFRWFPWLLEPWQQDGYSPIMSGLEYLGGVLLPGSVLSYHGT